MPLLLRAKPSAKSPRIPHLWKKIYFIYRTEFHSQHWSWLRVKASGQRLSFWSSQRWHSHEQRWDSLLRTYTNCCPSNRESNFLPRHPPPPWSTWQVQNFLHHRTHSSCGHKSPLKESPRTLTENKSHCCCFSPHNHSKFIDTYAPHAPQYSLFAHCHQCLPTEVAPSLASSSSSSGSSCVIRTNHVDLVTWISAFSIL